MKNSTEHNRGILSATLVASLLLSVFLIACRSDVKYDKSKLIPEKPFTSILSDMYLGGGLLSLPEIRTKFSMRDSIETYIDIIKSYGYTYDAMDNTLKYYFIKRPKKLLRIYDRILGNLSEMEAFYQNEPVEPPVREPNQWNGNPSFTFPDPAGNSNPEFSRTISIPSTFTFEATVVVYPDDPSVDPQMIFWYTDADSSETGKRVYISGLKYIKDGHPHTYTVTGKITEAHPVILHGSLFSCEDFGNEIYKHARISGIKFSIISFPV